MLELPFLRLLYVQYLEICSIQTRSYTLIFYPQSDSSFTRLYHEEVAMVLSGIECLLHDSNVIYCSSELTTGANLYEVLRASGLRAAMDLKARFGDAWYKKTIFDRNCRLAVEFADRVRAIVSGKTLVITPAPFTAPNWNQREYLSFWETLIRTKISSVWLNSNWQFSNGCTFEAAVALDAGLPTFDENGRPLDRLTLVSNVTTAISTLKSDGFDTKVIEENLKHMRVGLG